MGQSDDLFTLTDALKAQYEQQIAAMTPEDEAAVLQSFTTKWEQLTEMLRDFEAPDYIKRLKKRTFTLFRLLKLPEADLSDEERRRAVFALKYFTSDDDAIPDSIDVIGFADDAVVVSWLYRQLGRPLKKYADQL